MLLLCLLSVSRAAIVWSAPVPITDSTLDDPVLPLVPKHSRSEAEQDHLDALARFAAGRVAHQRGDNAAALRQYQRAARLDPNATAVLREIVPLAFELNQPSVAVRYALKAIEHEPTDPMLLRRLAAFITEEGDRNQALALYERAVAAAEKSGEKPSASSVFTDMEMGRLYYLSEKYPQAAERFAAVMKALEKPEEIGLDEAMRKAILGGGEVTYQLFGEAFLDADRYDDAIQAYQKANAIKADAPQLALSLARVYFKQGKLDDAQAKLDVFLTASRDDQGTIPYRLLADLLAAQKKSEALIPKLEKLHEARPKNIPLTYFLAEQNQQAGKTDRAQTLFQELLKDEDSPPPIEAYRGLLSIYTARGDATAILNVVGDSVGRTGALESLGNAAEQLTSNHELVTKVIDSAESAFSKDPASLTFGERLAAAQLALADRNFEAADQWFDRAMEIRSEKTPEPVLAWGLELFLADRYESAANIFRRVIDQKLLPSGNPTAHFYLAGALEMQGKTDEAVVVAREAAAMRKDSPQFAGRAAWILYHAKRLDDAKAEYQKLIAQFDDHYDSKESREVLRDARLVLSNIAVMQNDLPAAEEWLEQVLDEYPDDVGACNDLGYLYADQNKRPERARRMTQFAVDAEPKNAAYRDSLGWALYRVTGSRHPLPRKRRRAV
jgi:tetratricopeptide (TPR) repeat protein